MAPSLMLLPYPMVVFPVLITVSETLFGDALPELGRINAVPKHP